MQTSDEAIAGLGNEPPLIADGRSGPPDRREVSARWLSGTFLTGLTSTVLMGVALFAALDGREQLATPPEIADVRLASGRADAGQQAKEQRLSEPRQIARSRDRRRIEASMVSRVGDRDVIRTMPFVQVKMTLAAGYKPAGNYPAFDPLDVFAEEGASDTAATASLIYGAKVETEMSLKTVDFPIGTAAFDEQSTLTAAEIEQVVRSTSSGLTDGAVQVAALHYVDPHRFGDSLAADALLASQGVRIVPENVTVAPRPASEDTRFAYAEDIVPVPLEQDIREVFAEAGYEEADGMVRALSRATQSTVFPAGTVLRVGLQVSDDRARIVRASVYHRTEHQVTIALDDRRRLVVAEEPEPSPGVPTAFEDSPLPVARGTLPTLYDGIYRAASAYGLAPEMTKQLVRLLASDVDFQSRLSPADRIEVFFSEPNEDNSATGKSELLYVSATIGGNTRSLYRYRLQDGTHDYFDQDGRSAKQFLLRNPVPNGKFRSGFGARRHPILGYTKMHTGVDWSAPRGTPIIASGNGVVEKTGWAGGYGRQTIIRHANGYETSYNHQSAIAKGVSRGARVRQGQVIGYVGASGLATGDHLHYELMVNNTKVDPMRVRLPVGRSLKDGDLEAFQRERQRIDELLRDETPDSVKVASAKAL